MNELKNNYCDLDYAKLLINADEYSQIKAAVVGANGKKKKLKVTWSSSCGDVLWEEAMMMFRLTELGLREGAAIFRTMTKGKDVRWSSIVNKQTNTTERSPKATSRNGIFWTPTSVKGILTRPHKVFVPVSRTLPRYEREPREAGRGLCGSNAAEGMPFMR
jgi:hypothetical protein